MLPRQGNDISLRRRRAESLSRFDVKLCGLFRRYFARLNLMPRGAPILKAILRYFLHARHHLDFSWRCRYRHIVKCTTRFSRPPLVLFRRCAARDVYLR